jgi:hypothetical protein
MPEGKTNERVGRLTADDAACRELVAEALAFVGRR